MEILKMYLLTKVAHWINLKDNDWAATGLGMCSWNIVVFVQKLDLI